eukprot:3006100-Lingulodinium_polyedra.AAC.1
MRSGKGEKLPKRSDSTSAGVSWDLGRPERYSADRSGHGPGGPRRATENVEHGVPKSTPSYRPP